MEEKKIILFDGVCNLCNGFVNFVIRRDAHVKFHFAALQSAPGQVLLQQYNLSTDALDSFVLIQNGQAYRRSTAALMVLKELGWLWPLLYVFIVLPAPWRDFLYNGIAKKRYRWFGKKDQCMIPTPDVRQRFL